LTTSLHSQRRLPMSKFRTLIYGVSFRHSSILIISVLLLTLTNCARKNSPSETKSGEKTDWQAEGVLIDMRELDGCQWLIKLKDGKKLQPIYWAGGAPECKEGLIVRFSYEVAHDVASTCMAEDFNIRVLDYAIVKPGKKECVRVLDPYRVPWMIPLLDDYQPFSIVRYDYEDGWAYWFQCGQRNYLYDCQGNFLCESVGRAYDACMERVASMTNAEVIWVKNERK
jgi:hypothetical protein